MTLLVRPATAADSPRVAEIYRHYVTDTVITFEIDPPPATEWADRIAAAPVFDRWIDVELLQLDLDES